MIFEGKKKQELVDYCKKNHIANFSNKSKDELITHITKIEALKKCFRGIRDYGFIQQLELDNERKTIIRHNADNDKKEESLGDELERVQLEQTLAVSKLEKIRSDRNKTLVEPSEPSEPSEPLEPLEPEPAKSPEPEPLDPLEKMLVPRATDEELEQFINKIKDDYPCSNIEFSPHEHIYKDENYRRYKEYVYENSKSLGEHGEKLLLHGTDEQNINCILEDDFSLTNHSKHGTRLGKGIYFTDKVSLACHYSERGNLKKHIILCKVHVGNIMRGNGSGILDKMPDSDNRYDTIVDSIKNTQQYSKVKNNTYSIQGVITITINDKKSPLMKHYSALYSSSGMGKTAQITASGFKNYATANGLKGKAKANLKIHNTSDSKIEVYYKPENVSVYNAQLSDLKLMRHLGESVINNGDTASYHTYIGDTFMISNQTDIIRIVSITDKKEQVTILKDI